MTDYDDGYNSYLVGVPYDLNETNDWQQGWADAEDGCYQEGGDCDD